MLVAYFVLLMLMIRLGVAFSLVAKNRPNLSAWQIFRAAAYLAFKPMAYSFASCPPAQIWDGCAFAQTLVNEVPRFDEVILEDMRPSTGWTMNVVTESVPMGTPVEITQDRFRAVYPNVTKIWNPTFSGGCVGAPCSKVEHLIGHGADRLTYWKEEQSWGTELFCFDQLRNITHAKQHVDQIINKILRPATETINDMFIRKRALFWAKKHHIANGGEGAGSLYPTPLPDFTFQWTVNPLQTDEEIYFDCSAPPTHIFKLVPQMLQHRFEPLMRIGYGGENPFKDASPFIEIVSDMDTVWELDHLGGQQGIGGGDSPNVLGNWRFTNFDESTKFWRYGFTGQIGNFMVRTDMGQLRFNFVGDLGAGANGGNGNRYRYQIVLPMVNSITTGAGGQAGIGDDENPAYRNAQFRISIIFHKKAMMLLVPEAGEFNPDMPFGHRNLAGKWQFVMDNLGQDAQGQVIENKRRNKGQFIADFEIYVRPQYTEFMEVFFHKGEQQCIPNISTCNADPGYPAQVYNSDPVVCPVQSAFAGLYGLGVPTGAPVPNAIPVLPPNQDGPVPQPPAAIPAGFQDQ
jgi:hypothetical protein